MLLRGRARVSLRAPRSRWTSIVPEVLVSSPARMRKRVVFPQPDGPTMQKNSPARIFKSMPASAMTARPFSAKRFRTPSRTILFAGASNWSADFWSAEGVPPTILPFCSLLFRQLAGHTPRRQATKSQAISLLKMREDASPFHVARTKCLSAASLYFYAQLASATFCGNACRASFQPLGTPRRSPLARSLWQDISMAESRLGSWAGVGLY